MPTCRYYNRQPSTGHTETTLYNIEMLSGHEFKSCLGVQNRGEV
jgi:hypothetical protein